MSGAAHICTRDKAELLSGVREKNKKCLVLWEHHRKKSMPRNEAKHASASAVGFQRMLWALNVVSVPLACVYVFFIVDVCSNLRCFKWQHNVLQGNASSGLFVAAGFGVSFMQLRKGVFQGGCRFAAPFSWTYPGGRRVLFHDG